MCNQSGVIRHLALHLHSHSHCMAYYQLQQNMSVHQNYVILYKKGCLFIVIVHFHHTDSSFQLI